MSGNQEYTGWGQTVTDVLKVYDAVKKEKINNAVESPAREPQTNALLTLSVVVRDTGTLIWKALLSRK